MSELWKAGAAALAALALGVGAKERAVDLGAIELGQPPAGFEFARTGGGPVGTWAVVPDESATGGRAIAQTSADPTDWHSLGLRAEGDRFAVMFDGAELFSVHDTTFLEAGRVALWTKADSITRFDSIAIRSLP